MDILTASKGILVGGSSMISNFYPSLLLNRIVVEIDVGAFVEAVVRGFPRGSVKVIVHVCEARWKSACV